MRKPIKPRLSVVSPVYHSLPGQSPTAVDCRWGRSLDSDEQPYQRRVTLTEDWQPIDSGWCKDDVGYLIVTNDEGKNLQVQPTAEERREIASRVIEVGFTSSPDVPTATVEPRLCILPGEAQPLSVCNVASVRVRCRKGKAKATVTAYPR